ncbi:DEAD/DEAH box helicase [Nocardia thraciensis]
MRLPNRPAEWLTVDFIRPDGEGGWIVYAAAPGSDNLAKIHLTEDEAAAVEALEPDGGGSSAGVVAAMWTVWMATADATALANPPGETALRPYIHQHNAVYGAMLPQPRLRFLLADEPGTGKTIMAGLYLREMRRRGLVRRALVVAPAGLVTKWQADFDRFFGGGLRRVTAATIREGGLETDHPLWITSLELAAGNPAVQDMIHPDRSGWDVVVFDEAHRLTPTARSLYQVGRLLTRHTPRILLMTATPHRGSEWLFRHLLHLVDHEIYPDPGMDSALSLPPLRPGPTHFLRRMKEDLVDHDGTTPLFKKRRATNFRIPLSPYEANIYTQAIAMVDQFFPVRARTLARMVYGKRGASSLHALSCTLRRRVSGMGLQSPAEAALEADPDDEDAPIQDEARVICVESRAAQAERLAIHELLDRIHSRAADYIPSKWRMLVDDCLSVNGITPGRGQAVIFSEYSDTAEWIAHCLTLDGYSARVYSGRYSHTERDDIRKAFMAGRFQIIVSTDAGNEGIDLQVAHVLINYDIPWSLVRLEQRMGRIHRVGQTRDVELYNLVATGTREGDTLHKLLENFVTAANELGGMMFDSLSVVAELAEVPYEQWLRTLYADNESECADIAAAVDRVTVSRLLQQAESAHRQEARLASEIDSKTGMAHVRESILQQVNPAIVEAYLRRLDAAGVVQAHHTAAGEGVMLLESTNQTTTALGAGVRVFLDTECRGAATIDAAPFGPGSLAFTELTALASNALAPDAFRGSAADDPSAASPYYLIVFTSSLRALASREPWSVLIRVDSDCRTRRVAWECLARLVPMQRSSGVVDAATIAVAASEAARILSAAVEERKEEARRGYSGAKRELANLPVDLTLEVDDRSERIAARDRIAHAVEQRLCELDRLYRVEADQPQVAAYLSVAPAASATIAVERHQAHSIAAEHAAGLFTSDGWTVEDVRKQLRGFALRATHGDQQLFICAYGMWQAAAEEGITLRGDEILMATQHRENYVLYLVEYCQNGHGSLYARVPDPVAAFPDLLKTEAATHITGKTLESYLAGRYQADHH